MTKTLKRKWLKALRSGDYKMGRGRLRQTDEDGTVRHCCLGVLCEITKTPYRPTDAIPPGDAERKWGLDEQANANVQRRLGIGPGETHTVALIGLNDSSKRLSYRRAIAYIDRYL